MKKILVVIVGILLIAAVALALGTSAAVAGPGGHHGFHKFHGFAGFGPGFVASGSSAVVDDECPLVKRCYINKFGEKRCRWIQQCD